MDINEAKNEIEKLRADLAQVEKEYEGLYMICKETEKKTRLCESKKCDIKNEIKKLEDFVKKTENVFETVKDVEGFETLSPSELNAISNGMDKTDYTIYGKYPRWIDLERLVKHVIQFKKLYPGWILDRVIKLNQCETVLVSPTFYKFTYNTPLGHYMSCGGIELE
jgi:hypothetical protein